MNQLEPRRRVLITGGSGFLGSAVVDLLAQEFNVVVYDLACPEPSLRCSDYVEGDILDADRLADVMDGCEAVFHFAGRLGVLECQTDEKQVVHVNADGTRCVARVVEATPSVRQVVAISSSEVYGEGLGRVLHEDEVLLPRSTYAHSKVALEAELRALGGKGRHAVTVLRPFNVYGPRQRPDFVVPQFCLQALAGEPITVFGTGGQERTLTFIDDAAHGIIGAFHCQRERKDPFSVYNVTACDTISMLALAEEIWRLAGSRSDIRLVPLERGSERRPEEEIYQRVPSGEKALEHFGFKPTVSLVDGLTRTLDWYRAQPAVVRAPISGTL